MGKLKVEGLDELQKALKDKVTLDDVKRVVRHNGSQLQQKMQANADFKKGYQTGTTKRSIGLEVKDSGLTAEVGPETEYAPYVEWGTRYMESQSFVRPAYDSQKKKFKSDMEELVK